MTDPVPMELVGVRLELPTNTPILLLRETGGSRYLPIWIGTNEATAIALALEGVEPQRPLTHDLLKAITESLGAVVSRVVVTELTDGTFFADLVMTRNGEEVHVSSRPSDAIALAARTESPVFAARSVLDEVGVEIHDSDEEEAEIEKFREFLEEVTPEDFDPTEGGPGAAEAGDAESDDAESDDADPEDVDRDDVDRDDVDPDGGTASPSA